MCESADMLHCLRVGLGAAVLGAWLPTASPLAAAADGAPLARQSALRFQYFVVDEQPPRNPWVKLAGDFNGDGKLDIAIGGQSGPLVWYANPDWRQIQVAERGWNTVGGAVGDVDGDGHADIVTARMHQGAAPQEVSVYLNLAKENSWRKVVLSERGSHDILVADFNGDGRPDILGANHGGPLQPVELWLSLAPKRAAAGTGRDAERNDFRLRPGSPATKIGFQPWDFSAVGPRPAVSK